MERTPVVSSQCERNKSASVLGEQYVDTDDVQEEKGAIQYEERGVDFGLVGRGERKLDDIRTALQTTLPIILFIRILSVLVFLHQPLFGVCMYVCMYCSSADGKSSGSNSGRQQQQLEQHGTQ
ncbi:unnamed protein product [Brugia pahangi]|uniref:Transmembrane protein n=1 Tax=Brugia pahangi TaxID=6280 RepID=A0A0N4TJW4_BRUPA|nr:unnamed protein product [Brugia pahangi]